MNALALILLCDDAGVLSGNLLAAWALGTDLRPAMLPEGRRAIRTWVRLFAGHRPSEALVEPAAKQWEW